MKKIIPARLPWKIYVITTIETIMGFYLATFCFALFLLKNGTDWLLMTILMGILYCAIVGLCITRIIQKFSLAALMLIVPIAPLLALIAVVSLIPVLELLK